MIEDKKIENLFRDNQHKLDEMPPSMVWDKLEVRLEKRDLNHKQFMWRRLSIAAAVFIAVSMIGVWMYINPLGNTMNQTAELFPKKELASEIIASDAPTPARPILMSHREKVQYLDDVSNTRMNTRPALAENKPRKPTTNVSPAKIAPQANSKPIPAPKADATNGITTIDMTVQADSEPAAEPKMPEEIEDEEIIEGALALEKNASKSIVYDNATDSSKDIKETSFSYTPPPTTTGNVAGTYDLEVPSSSYLEVEAEEDDIVVMEEVAAKETKKIRKAKRSADKATAKDFRSQSTTPAAAAKPEPELDRFDWLLGKWTDEDDNSFEEWQRIAPNILEGKGYFVVDVDTTFTQSMKIVQSNAQVFFMVDGQAVEGKFELEKYDDRTATFKNKNEASEQITLKKDANNAYSVTIEKSKRQVARERKKKKRTFKRVNE